jgi:hypothetical protein
VEEGAKFLESSISSSDNKAVDSEEKKNALLRISRIFHGYPLALAQVAGFIVSGGATVLTFERLLQDQKHSSAIAALPVDDYHASLATVWDLPLGSLSPECQLVWDIMTFLDPDSVPYELFEEGCRDETSPSIYEGSELKLARVMYHCSTWEIHFAPCASAN